MKDSYTIGEISKLLNLGNDAIRFYEKKGLVHPKTNPDNQYRMYDMSNILELLDVIYYRHLEVSLSEIQQLHSHQDKEQTKQLLRKKQEETKRKITYQQQLLKKLSYMLQLYDQSSEISDLPVLDQMPSFYILFEDKETTDFFQKQIQHLTEEEFVFCSIMKEYNIHEEKIVKKKSLIVVEQQVAHDLHINLKQDHPTLKQHQCVSMLLPMPRKSYTMQELAPLFQFAKKSGYSIESKLYIKEIPMTFYGDYENYYAQIYLPVKKE